jgi:hypothetical protein
MLKNNNIVAVEDCNRIPRADKVDNRLCNEFAIIINKVPTQEGRPLLTDYLLYFKVNWSAESEKNVLHIRN